MPAPMTATEVLDREFLEIRAKLLELAASLDRLDRGEGSVASDRRRRLIAEGIEILRRPEAGRAEAVQLLFSRTYDEGWRRALNV